MEKNEIVSNIKETTNKITIKIKVNNIIVYVYYDKKTNKIGFKDKFNTIEIFLTKKLFYFSFKKWKELIFWFLQHFDITEQELLYTSKLSSEVAKTFLILLNYIKRSKK